MFEFTHPELYEVIPLDDTVNDGGEDGNGGDDKPRKEILLFVLDRPQHQHHVGEDEEDCREHNDDQVQTDHSQI